MAAAAAAAPSTASSSMTPPHLGEWAEVRDAGHGRGRGVYATQRIPKGQVIFIDPAYVSVQLSGADDDDADTVDGWDADARRPRACGNCLTAIGSVAFSQSHMLSS